MPSSSLIPGRNGNPLVRAVAPAYIVVRDIDQRQAAADAFEQPPPAAPTRAHRSRRGHGVSTRGPRSLPLHRRQAPSVVELRRRYTRQVVGQSEDGSEWWLNWVVRRRDDLGAVGYVQATVTRIPGGFQAEVAWVIGTRHHHQGFAQAAAALMVGWLRQCGVPTIVAHIHPHHHASAVVARSIGLTPTRQVEDGEVRWQG
ncbi:MAG: GNAT family N-acetyltransferase [Pseudonocardiaceae bacterium]